MFFLGVESEIEYNELEIQVEKADIESDVPVELSELDQVLSVGSTIVDLEVDIKNKEVDKQVKEVIIVCLFIFDVKLSLHC